MKKIVLTLCCIFAFHIAGHLFASEIPANSRITEVTVYPNSALINRVATLNLDAGEHRIIFADIIPDVDENSLRVSGQGSAEVKLFGVQVKKEFLEEEPAEKVKQLQDEIEKLEDEIKVAKNLKDVLAQEKNFLDSIRLFSREQIPKDLVTKMPAAQELGNMLNFLDTKLKDNYAQTLDCELKIRELDKKAEVLRKELTQISGSQKKLKRSIVVELEALKPGNINLTVAYLVRGASWQPIYDARAQFDKSEVELVAYGIVRQATGEEWPGVELSLATAKPSIGARMPYIAPWFLRPYQPPVLRERESKARAAYRKADVALREPAGLGGGTDEIRAPVEVAYSSPEEKGLAVVYKLAKKASIKPDGSEHKVPISSQFLKAKFEYSCYPRAVLNAYLGSRVTNADNLQLLTGRMNVFLEGSFVGISSIDNIGLGEEFDLYLGVDENVKVKREQIEKKIDETLIGGIPSTSKRTIFKYKLTVENYKSKKINAKLFEAMPISEDDRIKVKIEKVSLEPKQKDWQDKKGVWLWELELEPKAKQEISYTYIVEHPRQMQVEGL